MGGWGERRTVPQSPADQSDILNHPPEGSLSLLFVRVQESGVLEDLEEDRVGQLGELWHVLGLACGVGRRRKRVHHPTHKSRRDTNQYSRVSDGSFETTRYERTDWERILY